MFDPHRIGPKRSSSYSRNKGRAIQRRIVPTPSPNLTLRDLESLYPLMERNGFIPEPTLPYLGKVVQWGTWINTGQNDIEATQINPVVNGQTVTFPERGLYLIFAPGYTFGGFLGYDHKWLMIRSIAINTAGAITFSDGLPAESTYFKIASTPGAGYIYGPWLQGENGTEFRVTMRYGETLNAPATTSLWLGGYAFEI